MQHEDSMSGGVDWAKVDRLILGAMNHEVVGVSLGPTTTYGVLSHGGGAPAWVASPSHDFTMAMKAAVQVGHTMTQEGTVQTVDGPISNACEHGATMITVLCLNDEPELWGATFFSLGQDDWEDGNQWYMRAAMYPYTAVADTGQQAICLALLALLGISAPPL